MTMTETKQRKDRQINQLIIHNLIEIIELYPNWRVSQHLSFLSDKKDFYYWTNTELLKELEKYKIKLENEYEEEMYD